MMHYKHKLLGDSIVIDLILEYVSMDHSKDMWFKSSFYFSCIELLIRSIGSFNISQFLECDSWDVSLDEDGSFYLNIYYEDDNEVD